MAAVSRNMVKKVLSLGNLRGLPQGAGAVVRRSIGSMQLRNLTPFLMLDHFHIAKGAGFPDHPHRGQATVTYIMQGASKHEDSAVIHAEMPVSEPGKPEPRGLQLWVDLPKQYKMAEPSYQDLEPENIPSAFPEGPDGPEIRVISGKSHGHESPVRPLGGCWYFHAKFKRPGKIFQDLPAGWTAFIYTLNGKITCWRLEDTHDPFHTLVLSANGNETGISVSALENDTDFVLIAGEPLDQPVVQYGPFVMTTKEEIQKTFMDYRTGQNGFEKAHVWKSKIGGL
ncbi:pirin domain-containing protein [Lactarius indigo]|nr:pirin domain-containing protein [Lactarius indigo]